MCVKIHCFGENCFLYFATNILFVFYFSTHVILSLANTDIPLLIQLVRLVDTTVHNQSQWYELIIDNKCEFFTNVQHLFENCLNQDLLRLLFQLINHLLYKYDDLGKQL